VRTAASSPFRQICHNGNRWDNRRGSEITDIQGRTDTQAGIGEDAAQVEGLFSMNWACELAFLAVNDAKHASAGIVARYHRLRNGWHR
jgi:hypothetical protein